MARRAARTGRSEFDVSWIDQTLEDLAALPAIGYLSDGHAAAEPTALAALAFAAHDRPDDARKAAAALVSMQQANGEVVIRAGEQSPGWTTSLAVVAWNRIARDEYRAQIDRAIAWLLSNRGRAVERSDNFGHNTELIGWAYAEQTHSWVEPTAFGVLALKAAGSSPRNPEPASKRQIDEGPKSGIAPEAAIREGIAVLIDRQLPGGGLNYGNTEVLGQYLRAHVEPTGIALIALAGEMDVSGRIAKSVAWLRRNIGPTTTPLSIGWALLGLRAHGIELPPADPWLSAAAEMVRGRNRSPHKLALLALAAKGWPL
jgi:hypothetical protein